MPLDLVQTLAELIAIPSVNPMGRAETESPYLESRVTDYLERHFTQLRLPYLRQAVHPGRENILARMEGRGAAADRLVLLDVHQDTVPVEGMTIPPFTPHIERGRMYGRGSCDVKGGMTAMIGALVELMESPAESLPTIVLACTVNEESGFTGAKEVSRLWQDLAGGAPFVGRRPDLAIVAEPTDLHVVVAHKGSVRWRCHTLGRAAHSSAPHQGQNAIFAMAHVLAVLEGLQAEIGRLGEHPLCGRPTLSVGAIAGGISVNTVPDHAVIEIDRRLMPSESPDEAYHSLVEQINAGAGLGERVRHDPPMMRSRGLTDGANLPLAESLAQSARAVAGRSELVGVPYGTNAAIYAAADVPTVVFGPGSIAQAHTEDEWIELDQIGLASTIYARFCRDLAG